MTEKIKKSKKRVDFFLIVYYNNIYVLKITNECAFSSVGRAVDS